MGSGETKLDTVTGQCAADIGGALLCKRVAAGWQVVSAAGGQVDGISAYDGSNGDALAFYQSGIHPVICGAAVAQGDPLMSDAAGHAITFAAGSGHFHCGIAENATTASGQIVNVLMRLGQVAG
jgi:hypothetical protein